MKAPWRSLVFWLVAATAASAPAAGRTGILVYLDADSRATLPVPVAEIRTAVEGALSAGGGDDLPAGALNGLAGEWRVRTGLSIPPGFRAALRDSAGLADLTVVHVLVGPRRALLLARRVQLSTARVQTVWLAEHRLEPPLAGRESRAEAEALLAALAALGGDFATDQRPEFAAEATPGGRVRVVLPAVPVGCDHQDVLVATHALLRAAIEAGVPVADPGLVAGALHAAGGDPARVDAPAREILQSVFDATEILHWELMSAGGMVEPSRAAQFESADDAAPIAAPATAYVVNLYLIDAGSGLLMTTASAGADADAADPSGWFGLQRRVSSLARLTDVTSAASTTLARQQKDSFHED